MIFLFPRIRRLDADRLFFPKFVAQLKTTLLQDMKVTITSLELKSPWKFFSLSYQAMKILQQLATTDCVEKKSTGFWTKHYTMTLWKTEGDLKNFAKSGKHFESMKKGAQIAKEIRTLTMDATKLPNWKEAKAVLNEKGRIIRYDH
jgi:hypothetical protein